ncbi:MAG: hypothetical protein WCI02_17080 [Planctomycetota bacterium]
MKTDREKSQTDDVNPVNPYEPPRSSEPIASGIDRVLTDKRRRSIALQILGVTTGLAVLYTIVDEGVLGTGVGAWPMLFGSCLIAIATVFMTRDWLISPLCCFVPTCAGDAVAGLIRGWAYAEVAYCVPLALAFSIPALVIGLIQRLYIRRFSNPETDARMERPES